MSDEWDFYFARVNDAVSSIFVDLGIRPDVPVEKRPWLLWVWVQLQSAWPDGLSSNEEAPKLNEIGEALDSMISPTCGAQLVGRITGSGRREFYFYGAEPGELGDAAARAMQPFEGYKFDMGSTFQPDWDQYLMLYPSDSNLERMQNRRMLESLEEQGDVHELPRKVDHWLYFADEAMRAACRDNLTSGEFALEEEALLEGAEHERPYQLVVSRVTGIDSHTINAITLELARLAAEYDGVYEGWGCDVTVVETVQ